MGKTRDFLLAIGIGLAVAAASIPAAYTLVLLLLIPAPLILLALRRGYWTGILGLLTFCLVHALLLGPFAGGTILLLTVFLVAEVPILLRGQRPYMEYLLYCAGMVLIPLLLLMGAYAFIAGESLFTALVAGTEKFLTDNQQLLTPFLDSYRQIGILDPDATVVDLITLMVSQIKDLAPFVPGFVLTVSTLAGGLNLMIPYRLAVRKGVEMPLIPPFSRWRLPRGTFLGFLALGILAFILNAVNDTIGQPVLYTVSALFLFVYSVQGLSVTVFLMDRSRMSGALKVILCLLLYIFLTTLLFMVGVFEQFLHIRELLEHMKDR